MTGRSIAPLIVVTGVPGAGKTTLGTAPARALRVPLVSLDAIKERLYTGDQSRDPLQLRLAAEAELRSRLADTNTTVIVDIWIAPMRDTERVADLLRESRRDIVEVLCRVPADLAVERYALRRRSGPHRPADASTLQRIREAVDRFEPLPIGRCLEVDTTQPVDIDSLIEQIQR